MHRNDVTISPLKSRITPDDLMEVDESVSVLNSSLESELEESKAQQKFSEILHRTINSTSNVCFYGPVGTGKTEMLRQLYMALREKYNVAVTALTGQAAEELRKKFHNCQAKTLHRWSGCCTNNDNEDMKRRMEMHNQVVETDILLIDDFSMLGKFLFEEINERCQEKSDCKDKPFGGIRVIVAGDPYLLPPICDKNKKNVPPCFESSIWNEFNFVNENLKFPFRYKDEIWWFKSLDKIRTGKATFSDLEVIKKSKSTESVININLYNHWKVHRQHAASELVTCIYGTNKKVKAHNTEQLQFIDNPIIELKSHDIPVHKPEIFAKEINEKLDGLADRIIQVKIGAFVVITSNQEDAFTGTSGIISAIENDYLVIDINKKEKLIVTPVTYDDFIIKKTDGDLDHKIIVKRIQFPIMLGYAMTVFKAQGTEFDKIVVHASNLQRAGQLYTALSRVKKFENLVVSWDAEEWKTHELNKYSENGDIFYKKKINDSGIFSHLRKRFSF